MPLIEVNGFGVEVQKLGIETSSGVAGSHAAGVFLLLTVDCCVGGDDRVGDPIISVESVRSV